MLCWWLVTDKLHSFHSFIHLTIYWNKKYFILYDLTLNIPKFCQIIVKMSYTLNIILHFTKICAFKRHIIGTGHSFCSRIQNCKKVNVNLCAFTCIENNFLYSVWLTDLKPSWQGQSTVFIFSACTIGPQPSLLKKSKHC
jgi:hypothetical protein